MKKDLTQVRQGDILLRRIGSIPAGFRPSSDLVLAVGEATGHAHRLVPCSPGAVRVHRGAGGGQICVQILAPTELQHEEHPSVPLRPGIYEVVRQREYSPTGNRTVMD